MKKCLMLFCVVITICLMSIMQCEKIGPNERQQIVESPEIKDLLIKTYAGVSAGKIIEAVEPLYSLDPHLLVIGSDPSEWIQGYKSVMEMYKPMEKMGTFTIQVDELKAYSQGDFGWSIDRVTITMPNGSKLKMRETYLYRKEVGVWKVVHVHASVGMGNEQAGFVAAPQ